MGVIGAFSSVVESIGNSLHARYEKTLITGDFRKRVCVALSLPPTRRVFGDTYKNLKAAKAGVCPQTPEGRYAYLNALDKAAEAKKANLVAPSSSRFTGARVFSAVLTGPSARFTGLWGLGGGADSLRLSDRLYRGSLLPAESSVNTGYIGAFPVVSSGGFERDTGAVVNRRSMGLMEGLPSAHTGARVFNIKKSQIGIGGSWVPVPTREAAKPVGQAPSLPARPGSRLSPLKISSDQAPSLPARSGSRPKPLKISSVEGPSLPARPAKREGPPVPQKIRKEDSRSTGVSSRS